MRHQHLHTFIATLSTLVAPIVAIAADPPAIDVSCVRPEHFLAIVIRPKRIAESPLVASLMNDPQIAAGIKHFGVDPREIEQAIVLMPAFAEEPRGRLDPSEPVLVLNFTHDVSAKELVPPLLHRVNMQSKEAAVEATIGGKVIGLALQSRPRGMYRTWFLSSHKLPRHVQEVTPRVLLMAQYRLRSSHRLRW